MLKKFRGKLFISIAAAALIGVAFSFYANTAQLKDALLLFSYRILPVVLGFVLLNYLFRFLRWEYYLRVLKIQIPRA
ncbi:MAG: hypothetical protein ACLP05_00415, partial [Candidatus Kryptoniota bacterium]